MTDYTVNYSSGTSKHDERRFTITLQANDFAEAGQMAVRFAARRGVRITAIALTTYTETHND